METKHAVVPEDKRARLEQRHAAERNALAKHKVAAGRLARAEERRSEALAEQETKTAAVVAEHDEFVAAARGEVVDTAVALAALVGATGAAELTGVSVTTLRRAAKEAR